MTVFSEEFRSECKNFDVDASNKELSKKRQQLCYQTIIYNINVIIEAARQDLHCLCLAKNDSFFDHAELIKENIQQIEYFLRYRDTIEYELRSKTKLK